MTPLSNVPQSAARRAHRAACDTIRRAMYVVQATRISTALLSGSAQQSSCSEKHRLYVHANMQCSNDFRNHSKFPSQGFVLNE